MEKLKKCHFNCGDSDLEKHTCGCYNDWLRENQESMENKHTPEYKKLLVKLEAYGEANDLLKQEAASLQSEIDRLKKDLLDALDLKEGNGPTALSMLKGEIDRLKEEKKELVSVLTDFTAWCEYPDVSKKVLGISQATIFHTAKNLLTRIK